MFYFRPTAESAVVPNVLTTDEARRIAPTLSLGASLLLAASKPSSAVRSTVNGLKRVWWVTLKLSKDTLSR